MSTSHPITGTHPTSALVTQHRDTTMLPLLYIYQPKMKLAFRLIYTAF